MDLKRLRYFCTVVEQGSITRAAEVLNMAQPPLSKRLQELEEELGVALFLRQGRRIEPTPAGHYLYQKAGEILRDVEATARETVLFAKRETKLLRIGLTHLFQSYFKDLILEIHRCHPDVELSIQVSDSSHLELLLTNGLLDIALIQRPARSDGYDCITLAPISLKAVVHTSLLGGATPHHLSLAEIGRFPLLLLKRASGTGTAELLLNQMRKAGVQPNVMMHVSQPGVILEWLESGLVAASLLPASEIVAERLPHCTVLEITPAPQVFYPSIVKLTTAPYLREVMELIEVGYPFPS